MPQLIALTTGYAQFVQASYLLLPIFGKSTIFGIFRKSGKIGFFGHFLSIFGHFLTIFDKIFIFGRFFKIGANPPDFGCWGRFFPKIGHCGTNGNRFFVLSGFFNKETRSEKISNKRHKTTMNLIEKRCTLGTRRPFGPILPSIHFSLAK